MTGVRNTCSYLRIWKYGGNCTTILAEGSILGVERRNVRPLQQHFNWLALWVFKKNIRWKLGAILYKTILIKKEKKNIYIYLQTHTQSLHSLSQTCHIMSDHNHCCLHYSDGTGFFLCGMSKYMRSDWKTKNRENHAGFPPHQHNLFVFTKMSFVHEQVSDMQTSTLSRNKYTRRKPERIVRRSNSFLIKRDTDNLDRGYTETFYSMTIFVCHQQHGHTDIVGQGHFYHAFTQKSELLLIDRTSSLGCITEPFLDTKKGVFFFFLLLLLKFACR